MSTSKEKKPRDVFERIEDEDANDEARRILAMSDAELDRELAAGGFDPAAVREKGRALGESLTRAARRARLVKTAKIGGLAVVVVAIAVGAAWLLRPPRATLPIGPEPPAPSAAPKPDAAPFEPAASTTKDDDDHHEKMGELKGIAIAPSTTADGVPANGERSPADAGRDGMLPRWKDDIPY